LALKKNFAALAALMVWSLLCASAVAQPVDPSGAAEQALATQFPPESIDSVDRANDALALVPGARSEIVRRVARQRAQCYAQFFTSSCLIDLRESERRATKAVRRVEVEANALLRRERAAERDRAVADRERRAAEQRAKSVPITGKARNAESPGATESSLEPAGIEAVKPEPPEPPAPPSAPAPANETRP